MDTIEPAVTDAYALLRNDLVEHLEAADDWAGKVSERPGNVAKEDLERICGLVTDLTMIVRHIVFDHEENTHGNCQICDVPAPCAAVRTIHGTVKNPGHEFLPLVKQANGERFSGCHR
jgi:hypothetical protein